MAPRLARGDFGVPPEILYSRFSAASLASAPSSFIGVGSAGAGEFSFTLLGASTMDLGGEQGSGVFGLAGAGRRARVGAAGGGRAARRRARPASVLQLGVLVERYMRKVLRTRRGLIVQLAICFFLGCLCGQIHGPSGGTDEDSTSNIETSVTFYALFHAAFATFHRAAFAAACAPLFTRAADGLCFAPTLGDVGTTLSHPASSSHRALTPGERAALGLSEGFFRVSVGLEDAATLTTIFTQSVAAAAGAG